MTIPLSQSTFLQKQWMKIILGIFSRFRRGALTLYLPNGTTHTYGDKRSSLKAEIDVKNLNFFSRCLFDGDVGLGEAYMADYWDSSDLPGVIQFFIENKDTISDGQFRTAWVSRAFNRLRSLKQKNTLSGARKNIGRHYDISNDLFHLFLDQSMTYSCGLYTASNDTLENAQLNKLITIINKARIDNSDHVLDIGCGWGSFAIEAAKRTGCRVTGITVSDAQYSFAIDRVRKEGLDQQIKILLSDYREVQGHFDKIISIEMLEGVGHAYLGTFFQCCDRLLKPNGLLIVQVITYPDQEYDDYRKRFGWIPKHIFPGGLLPSLTAICKAMTASSSFIIEDLENIGFHYSRTLRDWRHRFQFAKELISQMGFDQEFQRKWIYYFSYCEAGFATRTINDYQLVLTRINNKDLPSWA